MDPEVYTESEKKQASAFSTQFLLGEAEYEVKDAKMSFKDVITFYLG